MSSSSAPLLPNQQRDHLANVRTMLAWVRTAITIITLGFVVSRFGLVLDELPGHKHRLGLGFAGVIGVAFVVAGGSLVVAAATEFLAVERAIDQGKIHVRRGMILALTGILAAVALVLAVYLVATG